MPFPLSNVHRTSTEPVDSKSVFKIFFIQESTTTMSGWISSQLKAAESLLQQIDQQAAESLRKNEASRSGGDLSPAIPKKPADILPPLKDQLKKKKNTPPLPSQSQSPVPEKSDFVGKSRIDVNLKADGTAPKVNPKSSLTDSDWTELLSAPSKTVNGSNGGVPRVSGLLKDGKRQVRSGSNLFALERKRSQAVVNSSARRSDVVLGDKVFGDILDGNQLSDISDSKHATIGVQGVSEKLKDASGVSVADDVIGGTNKDLPSPDLNVEVKNVQNKSSLTGVPITSSSKKTESLSASDDELNRETDSDSDSDLTSDSESEREREERRKRREQLLAEKAAAKAIEAIKDHENLVAKLEGEKQSLEKIIDERAKQQAQEASELQMTMMETMEAVDLEKQKHNNTRMEALMKLAKLETTNAELAKSLATAQWNLEVEVKRVAELHRQIELKESTHLDLTSKKKSHLSGNKLTALRGVEFEHEILQAEYTFVTDKVRQLQEKARTLETTIQETRGEIENPTEVEIELKRRLAQLTDHLIQKQAQVEALSSEKAMLMFRIEAVLRSLEESKSSLKTSTNNDIESGIWEVSNSRLQKGQKHVGSFVRQLDSIFWTGATFLRRNPTAKVWSFVYLVFLHLWVFYIFRSHTAVSYESGSSGAVVSLENINNTGV